MNSPGQVRRRVRLSTPRLRLDPVTTEDAPAFLRQWNHPEVGRFLWDGRPVARETVDEVIARSAQSFARQGYGLWALRRLPGAAVEGVPVPSAGPVGFCGFRVPEVQEDPEILFALERASWGLGLAGEAASVLLRYAFLTLGLPRVTAGANPANTASLRVLERMGMRRTVLVQTAIEDLLTYEITRTEWGLLPAASSGNL